MEFRTRLAAASLGLTAVVLALPAPAQEQKNTDFKAGFLTCNVESGWGFVFGSSRDLKCTYAPKPGVTERYTGSIKKFGVDIGYLDSAVIVWGVVAPTEDVSPGALAGNYAGATGSATVGVGLGANFLVGGSRNSFTLQPLSMEGGQGLNVAGGIAGLTLTYEKPS
jgi:Protein of unknown function (DUF992)